MSAWYESLFGGSYRHRLLNDGAPYRHEIWYKDLEGSRRSLKVLVKDHGHHVELLQECRLKGHMYDTPRDAGEAYLFTKLSQK